jgi:hypothetical protein
VEVVSDNYFDALGAAAARGRLFRESVGEPAGKIVAVISSTYWHRHFAADPSAVGASIRLRNRDLTIVGVAPDGFAGIDIDVATDIWVHSSGSFRSPTPQHVRNSDGCESWSGFSRTRREPERRPKAPPC